MESFGAGMAQALGGSQIGSLANAFQQVSSTGGSASIMSSGTAALQSQGTGIVSTATPMSLNGRVEVVLDVKGDGASKLDKNALQQAASEGLYKGLDQLLTYAIQRNQ